MTTDTAAVDFRDLKARVERWMESTVHCECACGQCGSTIYEFATGAHAVLAELEKQQERVSQLRVALGLTRTRLSPFAQILECIDDALEINS